ncbi:MAG: branched-chain amino acid transporter ATP-binding protein [Ramlibacter sp.]|nr:branched-chain amino acid transporter ATP-binding protein [Ramlibacter sp.]
MTPGAPLLEVQDLNKAYGGLQVTRDVSFALRSGDRVGLIGPNGAGKTTLVNLMTGLVAPSSGRVRLAGQDVTSLPQWQRVKRGLVRTFQITQLAPTLPVQQQVELAIHEREGSVRHQWRSLASYEAVHAQALQILKALRIGDLAQRRPVDLAYGQQRLVEIAIAMALQPKVLLLDEPMAGVPGGEREVVLQALAGLPSSLAILMIEHDMDLIFSFADRILVLAEGAVLAQGSPQEIRRHPAVLSAYLGAEAA